MIVSPPNTNPGLSMSWPVGRAGSVSVNNDESVFAESEVRARAGHVSLAFDWSYGYQTRVESLWGSHQTLDSLLTLTDCSHRRSYSSGKSVSHRDAGAPLFNARLWQFSSVFDDELKSLRFSFEFLVSRTCEIMDSLATLVPGVKDSNLAAFRNSIKEAHFWN